MPALGPTELNIVIVIVLFGVGRIGVTAGELDSGIRAFNDKMKGESEEIEKQSYRIISLRA